ncbi:hypothetical protein FHU33_0065 [Blastococcus colisei]|uniref:Uncharacterized protein n=1 Tax=Blastococcus colisei TaxID=1564162 RepID=A0A543P9G0_9ACTN|nr:hypothetical protein FHU33_0065 [Blastococcus colisei]
MRPVPVRCSSCLLRSPRGKPRSLDELLRLFRRRLPTPICCPPVRVSCLASCLGQGSGLRSGTELPHPECGSRISEITPSSSSSHVWKLGIEAVRAGQVPTTAVGRLWAVTVDLLSTRGHLDGCSPSSVGVHPLSPVSPCWIPRSCPARRRRRSVLRDRDRGMFAIPAGQGGIQGRIGVGGSTVGRRASVTSGDPSGTRSPQPVHIPGDNFSTSRRGSPTGHRQLPPRTRAPGVSTSFHGCGQPSGKQLRRPPDDTAANNFVVLRTTPRPGRWLRASRGRHPSRRVGPEGPRRRDSTAQRAGGRQLEAARSGGPQCHCLARLLMRAVSSVTCV